MIFLKAFLESWLSDASQGVMGIIVKGIRTLLYDITVVVYKLIANVYNLFYRLCNARLLDNEVLELISDRIGLILGLVMFFYVIFSMIQMLVDPEKINNKDSGAMSIVKKVIIVIVMLGVSNSAFSMLFGVQKLIIDSNVISKLILPMNIDEEADGNFGNLLSAELISAFYTVVGEEEDGYIIADSENENNRNSCTRITKRFYNDIYERGRYDLGNLCLNEAINVTRDTGNNQEQNYQVFIIDFNGLLAILVGGFTVYILAMYCFKVGIRLIQLTFLEIISPVAIIGYMLPSKDNMFKKWWSLYFSTYVDLFIRIAIIDLMVFIICVIFTSENLFWETIGNDITGLEKGFLTVVLVLSLLTFAKKAPDLLKELFPAGGKGSLGFGASMKDIVGLKAGLGMATGLATGAVVGAIGGIAGGKGWSRVTGLFGGAIGGAFRGGKAGFGSKGIGNAISTAATNQGKANMKRAERIYNGGSFWAGITDPMLSNLGFMSNDKTLSEQIATQDALEDAISKDSSVKMLDLAMNNLTIGGKDQNGNTITNQKQLEDAYNYYKDQKKIASATVLADAMEKKDKNNNVYLYAQRLTKQDSTSKAQIENISNLVKNNPKASNNILAAYKDFGTRNDTRKNTRERNRIQKGK